MGVGAGQCVVIVYAHGLCAVYACMWCVDVCACGLCMCVCIVIIIIMRSLSTPSQLSLRHIQQSNACLCDIRMCVHVCPLCVYMQCVRLCEGN